MSENIERLKTAIRDSDALDHESGCPICDALRAALAAVEQEMAALEAERDEISAICDAAGIGTHDICEPACHFTAAGRVARLAGRLENVRQQRDERPTWNEIEQLLEPFATSNPVTVREVARRTQQLRAEKAAQ